MYVDGDSGVAEGKKAEIPKLSAKGKGSGRPSFGRATTNVNECSHTGYTLYGGSWSSALGFRVSTTNKPSYLLLSSFEGDVIDAILNISQEQDPCYTGDQVSLVTSYQGTTTANVQIPAIGSSPGVACSGSGDGSSVTQFGAFNGFTAYAAVNCRWGLGSTYTETDNKLNWSYTWTGNSASCPSGGACVHGCGVAAR